MSVLLIVVSFGNGFSHLTVTSRIAYALARDDALPGSSWMKKLNAETRIPNNAIVVIFIIEALICAIPLSNLIAYNNVAYICSSCLQIAWIIPIALRIY